MTSTNCPRSTKVLRFGVRDTRLAIRIAALEMNMIRPTWNGKYPASGPSLAQPLPTRLLSIMTTTARAANIKATAISIVW